MHRVGSVALVPRGSAVKPLILFLYLSCRNVDAMTRNDLSENSEKKPKKSKADPPENSEGVPKAGPRRSRHGPGE